MRGAVGDDADFVAVVAHDLRPRNQRARGFELVRQAVHVVGVIVRTLAVLRLLVVSAAAREPCRSGMVGSRQGAIADAVAVHVLVAREAAQPFQIFRGQHLAAIHRLLGILERLRHPVVHAEIEIGHDEHRRLQLLGEIERLARHAEALGHAARKQHGMLGVAVRELGHETRCRPARCASAGRSRDPRAGCPRSRRESRRSSPGRRTPPSAKCPVRRWRSWSALPPILRPEPCRSQPVRPRPARWQRSLCHQARCDTPSCNR